jgi:predicted lipid carrier protein YhbT
MHSQQPDQHNLTPMRVFNGLLRPVPHRLIEKLAGHCMDGFRAGHPAVMDRLEPLNGQSLLICPDDLPHRFLFTFLGERIAVSVTGARNGVTADARIHGTFAAFIRLLEGRVDGDALFFNRLLRIEGDMELVLTLRNAVDDADIDFLQLVTATARRRFPPLGFLAARLQRIHAAMADDLAAIETALTAPLTRRIGRLESELDRRTRQDVARPSGRPSARRTEGAPV